MDEHVEVEEIKCLIGLDWMLDNFINLQATVDNKKTLRCLQTLEKFWRLHHNKKLHAEHISQMKLSHPPKVHQRIFLTSIIFAMHHNQWDIFLEKIPILQRVFPSITVKSCALSWVLSVQHCIIVAMDGKNKDKAKDILEQHKKYLSQEEVDNFNDLILKFEKCRSVHGFPSFDIRNYIRNVQLTVLELNRQIEVPTHVVIVQKFKSQNITQQHEDVNVKKTEEKQSDHRKNAIDSTIEENIPDEDVNVKKTEEKQSDHEKNAIDSTIEENIPGSSDTTGIEPQEIPSDEAVAGTSSSSEATVNTTSTKQKQCNISGKLILIKLKEHMKNVGETASTGAETAEDEPSTSGVKRGINKAHSPSTKEWISNDRDCRLRGIKRKLNINHNLESTTSSLSTSEFENRLQNDPPEISIHTEKNSDASDVISSQEVSHKNRKKKSKKLRVKLQHRPQCVYSRTSTPNKSTKKKNTVVEDSSSSSSSSDDEVFEEVEHTKKKKKKSKKLRVKLQHNTPSVYSRTSTPNKSTKKKKRIAVEDSSSSSSSSSEDENLGNNTKHNRLKAIHKYRKTPVQKERVTSAVLNRRCRAERQKELQDRRGISSHTKHPWQDHEVDFLMLGLKKFGVGKWSQILVHGKAVFKNRTAVMLKDKYRWLLKKGMIDN